MNAKLYSLCKVHSKNFKPFPRKKTVAAENVMELGSSLLQADCTRGQFLLAHVLESQGSDTEFAQESLTY